MFGRLRAFFRRKPAEGDDSVSKGTVEGVSWERETHDAVSHPSHYTSGNIEVIDFIEDQKMCYLNRYIGLLKNEQKAQEGSE